MAGEYGSFEGMRQVDVWIQFILKFRSNISRCCDKFIGVCGIIKKKTMMVKCFS